MHGYFTTTLEKDQKIDHSSSKSWTKCQKLKSHFEGYIPAIQKPEILTKFRAKK